MHGLCTHPDNRSAYSEQPSKLCTVASLFHHQQLSNGPFPQASKAARTGNYGRPTHVDRYADLRSGDGCDLVLLQDHGCGRDLGNPVVQPRLHAGRLLQRQNARLHPRNLRACSLLSHPRNHNQAVTATLLPSSTSGAGTAVTCNVGEDSVPDKAMECSFHPTTSATLHDSKIAPMCVQDSPSE